MRRRYRTSTTHHRPPAPAYTPEPALEPVPSRKQYFDSLENYLAYCEQTSDMPASLTKSRHPGRPLFMGTETFAAALDLARHGWTDGATMAKEYSAELHSKLDHPEAIEEGRRRDQERGAEDSFIESRDGEEGRDEPVVLHDAASFAFRRVRSRVLKRFRRRFVHSAL